MQGAIDTDGLIDFVSEQRKAFPFAELQNGLLVVVGPTGTERVAWIVHNDESGPLIDQSLHLFQVDLPPLLRVETVESRLDATDLRNGQQVREAWGREQKVIPGVGKQQSDQMQSMPASCSQENVLLIDHVCRSTVLGGQRPSIL